MIIACSGMFEPLFQTGRVVGFPYLGQNKYKAYQFVKCLVTDCSNYHSSVMEVQWKQVECTAHQNTSPKINPR